MYINAPNISNLYPVEKEIPERKCFGLQLPYVNADNVGINTTTEQQASNVQIKQEAKEKEEKKKKYRTTALNAS